MKQEMCGATAGSWTDLRNFWLKIRSGTPTWRNCAMQSGPRNAAFASAAGNSWASRRYATYGFGDWRRCVPPSGAPIPRRRGSAIWFGGSASPTLADLQQSTEAHMERFLRHAAACRCGMMPAAATPVRCTAGRDWGLPSSWARSNGGNPPSIAPIGEIVAGRHNDFYRSLWNAATGGKPGEWRIEARCDEQYCLAEGGVTWST